MTDTTAFAIAAHPDDIEFAMAGTLILLQQAGWEIHCLNLGSGNGGTETADYQTIVEQRRGEAKRACELIGAHYHESLTDDLEIFYEKDLLQRVGAIVRDVQPGIILTHSPQDYMEDHQNTCRLVVSAAFGRGMRNVPVNPPLPPVSHDLALYHAMPHGMRTPMRRKLRSEFYVDVSAVMEQKTALLACHESQKEWLDVSQGMDSYLHSMQAFTRQVGALSNRYEFAEGWRRHLHLGFSAREIDPLTEALEGGCHFDPDYATWLEGTMI